MVSISQFFGGGGEGRTQSGSSVRRASSRASSARTLPRESVASKRASSKVWWVAEVEEESLMVKREKEERRDNIATVIVAAEEERGRRLCELLLQRAMECVEREEVREIVRGMEEAERARRVREGDSAASDAREEQIRSRGDVQAVVEAERERQIGVYMAGRAEIEAAKNLQHRLQLAGAVLGRDIDGMVSLCVTSSQALMPAALARAADMSHHAAGQSSGGAAIEDEVGSDHGAVEWEESMRSGLNSAGEVDEAETSTPLTTASNAHAMWNEDSNMPTTSFSHRYKSRIPSNFDAVDVSTPLSEYSAASSAFPTPMPRGTVLSPGTSLVPPKQALFMTPGGGATSALFASADDVTRRVLTNAMASAGVLSLPMDDQPPSDAKMGRATVASLTTREEWAAVAPFTSPVVPLTMREEQAAAPKVGLIRREDEPLQDDSGKLYDFMRSNTHVVGRAKPRPASVEDKKETAPVDKRVTVGDVEYRYEMMFSTSGVEGFMGNKSASGRAGRASLWGSASNLDDETDRILSSLGVDSRRPR